MNPFDEIEAAVRGLRSRAMTGADAKVLSKIQRIHGLPVTGYLDDETMKVLRPLCECHLPPSWEDSRARNEQPSTRMLRLRSK